MANNDKTYKEISEMVCSKIEENRQNSALACYERGMRRNFPSKALQKDFGVDVAFCIFTSKNRTLCSSEFSVYPEDFKKAKLSENTCLNGFYKYEEFDNIDEIEVFKVGRETGLSCGKLVPVITSVSIDLTNESIKSAESFGEIPQTSSTTDKGCFIGYMKSPIYENRQKCYPTVWFDRQLVFYFRPGDFECGDSGASVVDQKGKALGILHSSWLTAFHRYAIASPYFAVFEALNVDFEEML